MAMKPSARLGPYEVLSPLGAGGMGEVYRARDGRLARDVAIKVLPQDSTSDPDRLRRFEQEAKAAGALNHPNLLAVFDAGLHDGAPYIVFELLEGRTLRQALAPGALPPRNAVDYAREIAHGLAAAHEKGIVHRDLKPENLFITGDGRVKILDFGLAKLRPVLDPEAARGATVSTATGAGVVLGTAGYMSPEQVRGDPADHRSDIFSFGSVFYEMLSGRRPFTGDSSAEVMAAIRREDPPELAKSGIPSGLERVVRRCLEKRPEERFQSARDVAFALEAVSGARTGIGLGPSRPARQLLFGAVVVALVLATLAFWAGWAPPTPRVKGITQITSDLVPKAGPVTDGPRVYFHAQPRIGNAVLAQVAARGGDVAPITTPFPDARVADVSADGAELLVLGSREPARDSLPELWIVPVVGGTPRRLGDIRALDAVWSPDGRAIAYTAGATGAEVHVASSDGSGSRRIWAAPGVCRSPAWSPDGRRLRLTVFDENALWAIWEIAADGRDPHPLLPAFEVPANGGRWTPDGKYFVFMGWEGFGHTHDIWVLREGTTWLSRRAREPVRLTHGPLNFGSPVPSRDGRRIFVVGEKPRGELVRYDIRSRQFAPFLSGISAHGVEFSRDGQWIAYSTYPEGALWRTRADGSDRLQLTRPPPHASEPHWSPHGKRLLFMGVSRSKRGPLVASYVISADGGPAEPVPTPDDQDWTASSWSLDGERLALWQPRAANIQLLDLRTGRFSKLAGSEGLLVPYWSPDGRHLAATSREGFRVLLHDFSSGRWREIAGASRDWPWLGWSHDGRSLFVSEGSARVRLWISNGRREVVASTEGLSLVQHAGNGMSGGNWVGRASDDSVIALRDLTAHEIFALDWEAP